MLIMQSQSAWVKYARVDYIIQPRGLIRSCHEGHEKRDSSIAASSNRSIGAEENVMSFILVSRVSYLAESANFYFKRAWICFFVTPKVKNTIHICKFAVLFASRVVMVCCWANIYCTKPKVHCALLGKKKCMQKNEIKKKLGYVVCTAKPAIFLPHAAQRVALQQASKRTAPAFI